MNYQTRINEKLALARKANGLFVSAEEKDLSEKEKAEILQNLFRAYVNWVKDLSEKLHVDKKALEEIFREEIK